MSTSLIVVAVLILVGAGAAAFFARRYWFGVRANPAAVPPVVAVRGRLGWFWAMVAGSVILATGLVSTGFLWNKMFRTDIPGADKPAETIAEAPSYPEGTTDGGTAAGSVPAAIIGALKKAKGEDVFFELKEMTYGDGETGKKLGGAKLLKAAAEIEAAKAKAKADAEAAKAKAEEMRRIGAYLIGQAAEERRQTMAAIEAVKRNATSTINLVEAQAGSANWRQLQGEGVRLSYKGRRMEATIQLQEAQDVLPEVRTAPRITPPPTPAERISAAKTRAEVAQAEKKACEAEAEYRVYKAGPKFRGPRW